MLMELDASYHKFSLECLVDLSSCLEESGKEPVQMKYGPSILMNFEKVPRPMSYVGYVQRFYKGMINMWALLPLACLKCGMFSSYNRHLTVREFLHSSRISSSPEIPLCQVSKEELANCFFLPNGIGVNLHVPPLIENFSTNLWTATQSWVSSKKLTIHENALICRYILEELTESRYLLLFYRELCDHDCRDQWQAAECPGASLNHHHNQCFLLKLGDHKSILIPISTSEYLLAYENLCSLMVEKYGDSSILQRVSIPCQTRMFSVHMMSEKEISTSRASPLALSGQIDTATHCQTERLSQSIFTHSFGALIRQVFSRNGYPAFLAAFFSCCFKLISMEIRNPHSSEKNHDFCRKIIESLKFLPKVWSFFV